jgi:glycine/D-amino acid oxidase-like deaminating enzyme
VDLKSGYPWWAVKNGLLHSFPKLARDESCEALVVGGGISGALIAKALADAGIEAMLVEQRDIGWGSTAASTALLQYEIDTHMVDLASWFGEEQAVLCYRACADAIPELQAMSREVTGVDFIPQQSLYVASNWLHRHRVHAEFEMRRRHGFDVEWLSAHELAARYGVRYPAGILSEPAAQVDPYRLTNGLLWKLRRRGVPVFDRTKVAALSADAKGALIRTADGLSVRARHAIIAAGYATQEWLRQKVAVNHSSYAFVTDPLPADVLGPWSQTLFWESARPYLYARTTRDHRFIIGGADDKVDIPARRDARVEKKVRALEKRAAATFGIGGLAADFAWGGTFAETADGLPFFGTHAQFGPRVIFAMAYGGNGITYSAIGASLICGLLQRRRHALSELFGFERLHR